MRLCVWCKKEVTREQLMQGLARNLMGYSHVACDNAYFDKQEKHIKYGRSHVIETEQI